MDPLLVVGIACFGTSIVSGLFGMAGGMILMLVCTAVLSPVDAMLVHGAAQLLANGSRAWLLRAHCDGRGLALWTIGAITPFAAFRFSGLALDAGWMQIAIGGSALLAQLAPARLAPRFDTRAGALGCGVAVMGAQLTAGVSGALLDVFFTRAELDRHAVVGTKAAAQALGHVAKLVHFGLLASASSATRAWSPLAFLLVAASAVAGTAVGRRLLDGLSDARFRGWTRGLVVLLSVVAIVQGWLALSAAPG